MNGEKDKEEKQAIPRRGKINEKTYLTLFGVRKKLKIT